MVPIAENTSSTVVALKPHNCSNACIPAKLVFTFDIGEDGEVEGCLATPYDGRREPDPKEYVWE